MSISLGRNSSPAQMQPYSAVSQVLASWTPSSQFWHVYVLATQWFMVCLSFYLRQCAVQSVAHRSCLDSTLVSLPRSVVLLLKFFSRPPAASSVLPPAYKHTVKSSSQTTSPDSLGGWSLPPHPRQLPPMFLPFSWWENPSGSWPPRAFHVLLSSVLAFTPSVRPPPPPLPWTLPAQSSTGCLFSSSPFLPKCPLPRLHFSSWLLSSLDVSFYRYLFTCSTSFPQWNIRFKREGGILSGFLHYS